MSDQELIWASLEAASETCEDLSPEIYRRFFDLFPQTREIFGLQNSSAPSLAMGAMVNEMLRLVTDGPENENAFANEMISVVSTHAGNGIVIDMYRSLLAAMADTVQDAAGSAWTPEMAQAWARASHRIVVSIHSAIESLGVS